MIRANMAGVVAGVLVFVIGIGLAVAQSEEATDWQTDPVHAANALYEEGKRFFNEGAYEKAIAAFDEALPLLRIDRLNYLRVLAARGQAHFSNGNLSAALRDVNEVLGYTGVEGGTVATAYHVRGLIMLKRGEDNRALKDFTAAIKVNRSDTPLLARSFSHRGVTFINLGKPHKALSDLNKSLQLEPDNAFALAARALAHLRQDHMKQARRDSERALTLNPGKRAQSLASKVLKELSISFSGPDRVVVPMDERGHIFVQLRFGRRGHRHRFLLDTGATYTLVSRSLFQEIQDDTKVKNLGKGRVRTASGSTHSVTAYRVDRAYVYNIPLGAIDVLVFDREGPNVHNLLGTKSLSQISISIDNLNKQAEIKHNSAARGVMR